MLHTHKRVEFVTPPNYLKGKVGAGGLPYKTIQKAQHLIDICDVDIIPEAKVLLIHIRKGLDLAWQDYKSGHGFTERARREITYPVMQLKSNGTMFHYPLITDIASKLLSFLENTPQINEDSLKMIEAHYKTLQLIVKMRIKEDREGITKQFIDELDSAHQRYKKRYNSVHANDDRMARDDRDIWYVN